MSKDDLVFLKDKDLLLNIIREIQHFGVVGEEDSIICLIIKVMLRFVLNANPISGNLVLSDKSGSGKDNLVRCVCSVLLSSDDYRCYTHITEKVLAYYKIDWNRKVLHIKDPPIDLLNSSVFKTIAEGRSSALVLSLDRKAETVDVVGKPVMLVTSVEFNVGEEALRRWDTCQLDCSPELTKAIIRYDCDIVCRGVFIDAKFVSVLQSGFKSCSVVIPFMKRLRDVFGFNMEMRTLFGRLLDYIRASAVLHQFQRKRDVDGNVIADWFDYEIGLFVFKHLNSVVGLPLSKDDLLLLEMLHLSVNGLLVRDILSEFPKGKPWLYRHLDNLKVLRLVVVTFGFDDLSGREIARYFISEDYLFRYSSDVVRHSEAFGDVKRFFERLDDNRRLLDLNMLFSKWLSKDKLFKDE